MDQTPKSRTSTWSEQIPKPDNSTLSLRSTPSADTFILVFEHIKAMHGKWTFECVKMRLNGAAHSEISHRGLPAGRRGGVPSQCWHVTPFNVPSEAQQALWGAVLRSATRCVVSPVRMRSLIAVPWWSVVSASSAPRAPASTRQLAWFSVAAWRRYSTSW